MSKEKVFMAPFKKKLEGNRCPHCGGNAEGGTGFDIDQPPPKQPGPGDFALCIYCGALNTYGEDLKLRAITDSEREVIQRDPRLRDTLQMAEDVAKSMRRKWQ